MKKKQILAAAMAFGMAFAGGHLMSGYGNIFGRSAVSMNVVDDGYFACVAEAAAQYSHDNFYWLGEMNKATIVTNLSEGLLTEDEARQFAEGLAKVLEDGEKPGAERPRLVTTFEPLLIDAAGEEVTKIHAGRSSQDMLSAATVMEMRERLLTLSENLTTLRRTLQKMAAENENTIVPAYTNGVQAQPERYAHYLLALDDAFARDEERVEEFYARINRSPLGSTVLNGTSWPLNREKMARYMGFDEIAYNTYDAVQVYSPEEGIEQGYVTTSVALHIGAFVEDIMQQYAQPRPWIMLEEGNGNTYASSAMPQKRNPGILNRARTNASTLLGMAAGASYRAHNIPPGMADPRGGEVLKMTEKTAELVADYNYILTALKIDPERSLEEINLDWSASQEVADVMMREYGVPFRLGHHFASEMVGFARANGYTPRDFPYDEARRIYRENVAGHLDLPDELPMSEAEFRETIDPVAIVNHRAVLGGPQESEMAVMMKRNADRLAVDEAWAKNERQKLKAAAARLDEDFEKLLGE
ncbi:MAG: lyase family protein [Selenomonadaceae bacterium]